MNQSFKIIQGNVLDLIKDLDLVHCVVTSPPYFQKRKYGDNNLELGNETTIQSYIDNLCEVFNNIPLHEEGSVWVNIGDKRNSHGGLNLIPDRFAIAMCDHGWKLIDHVVWAKVIDFNDGSAIGCCMIEPTETRLNGNGWEPFYRFVKNPKKCYCDHCAVRLPRGNCEINPYLNEDYMSVKTSTNGRSCHNVWKVAMGQTKIKHYAVYPEELCERPVAMTCPMKVSADGKLLSRRIVEMVEYDEGKTNKRIMGKYNSLNEEYNENNSKTLTGRVDSGKTYVPRKPHTVGWTDVGEDVKSGIVLDPFCGTGTTGVVSLKLGRSFVGIDLYDQFVDIAKNRCVNILNYMKENNLNPWESHK